MGSLLVTVTMMAMIVPTAALWAGAGSVLSTVMADDRRGRIVSVALAIILAATVAYVWI